MTTRTIPVFLVCALFGCSGDKTANAGDVQSEADLSRSVATGCDASLWNHVYNPTRLKKVSACVSVTGIVEESSADNDGDQHFLLRLDPGQDALANKRNDKKKSGNLVLEIVCANPTTMKKAKAVCKGYTNRIPIAAVGAHVRATGTYVIDSHNGWAEIHPVSKLEVM
jgi:hypothetical protein